MSSFDAWRKEGREDAQGKERRHKIRRNGRKFKKRRGREGEWKGDRQERSKGRKERRSEERREWDGGKMHLNRGGEEIKLAEGGAGAGVKGLIREGKRMREVRRRVWHCFRGGWEGYNTLFGGGDGRGEMSWFAEIRKPFRITLKAGRSNHIRVTLCVCEYVG